MVRGPGGTVLFWLSLAFFGVTAQGQEGDRPRTEGSVDESLVVRETIVQSIASASAWLGEPPVSPWTILASHSASLGVIGFSRPSR